MESETPRRPFFVAIAVGVNIVNLRLTRHKHEPAARWDRVLGFGFMTGTIVVYAVITAASLWGTGPLGSAGIGLCDEARKLSE